MKKSFLVLALLISCACLAQKPVVTKVLPLIPQPNSIIQTPGEFKLTKETGMVLLNERYRKEADYLNKYLKANFGFELQIISRDRAKGNYILIGETETGDGEGQNEEYKLIINKSKIEFLIESNAGLFFGIQTLIQLLPTVKTIELKLPCVEIADAPRYPWRGMHLDCCRHFFTKDEVKTYIDYLALYKFNVFHWHLTDDQGWRIEIKAYPRLTTIGSQRKETVVGKPAWDKNGKPAKDTKYDGIAHGGFYTQEDIKEIVAYAQSKYITVVPEIEMPGHSLAALASYPQFSCNGGPFETYTTWGVSDDVFCAGNDSTFNFIQNILDEVMALFPGKYIHIGGDECPKVRWQTCPKCQKRITDENLKDEFELQSYFITRIEKYVNTQGRQIIGWDEILEGGLAPNAAVMSWRGIAGGIAAAKQKHFVVMTPGKPCYFDHYQSRAKTKEPIAIGGFNPLDSVYLYNPTPRRLNAEESKFIMGAQGNVWTEYITDFRKVQYMAMPRMAALSETLWTQPSNKNYKNFVLRLKGHSKVLDKMKVNYARHFMVK